MVKLMLWVGKPSPVALWSSGPPDWLSGPQQGSAGMASTIVLLSPGSLVMPSRGHHRRSSLCAFYLSFLWVKRAFFSQQSLSLLVLLIEEGI